MHVNFCSKVPNKQFVKNIVEVAEQDAKNFFPESAPIGKKVVETIQPNEQYIKTMEAMKKGLNSEVLEIEKKIEADTIAEAYRAAHGIK